jgi:hypothetical protein
MESVDRLRLPISTRGISANNRSRRGKWNPRHSCDRGRAPLLPCVLTPRSFPLEPMDLRMNWLMPSFVLLSISSVKIPRPKTCLSCLRPNQKESIFLVQALVTKIPASISVLEDQVLPLVFSTPASNVAARCWILNPVTTTQASGRDINNNNSTILRVFF